MGKKSMYSAMYISTGIVFTLLELKENFKLPNFFVYNNFLAVECWYLKVRMYMFTKKWP